jgi:hypothetical protein
VAFSQKKALCHNVFRQRPDASLERTWLAERRHATARALGITFQLSCSAAPTRLSNNPQDKKVVALTPAHPGTQCPQLRCRPRPHESRTCMTWSTRCPNSAIVAPLAGAAEAPDAPTSPYPVATSTTRAILRILLSCLTSPAPVAATIPHWARSRKPHAQSLPADVYPTTAKFRPHPGQSVKTRSSLTAMRRLFPEMSDECLVYICLCRAYRRSGLYRSVVGSCRSRVVRVCDHRSVLGCLWLGPMRHPLWDHGRQAGNAIEGCSGPTVSNLSAQGTARRYCRHWLAMPKQPNGTPGEKPPAPSGKVRRRGR